MRTRLAVLSIALVLAAVAGRAQSRFKDLTPGESTRADVARVLGAATRAIDRTTSQYPAPGAGMARVEVTFDARDIAQRIEVYLNPPVTRRALTESYGVSLPDGRGDRNGRLVEYFAGQTLIAFIFVGENADSGVDSVAHFAPKAFTDASGIHLPDPGSSSGAGQTGSSAGNSGALSPGTAAAPAPKGKAEKTADVLNGLGNLIGAINSARGGRRSDWSVGNQSTLEGIYLSQYQSPGAERCQADCGGNASCRAYVFVRAGNPNPGDPSMCYLMSSATRAIPSPCCVAGVKGGAQ